MLFLCERRTRSNQHEDDEHGVKVPDWLIVDGADASSEAVLGLAAYVTATGDRTARTALRQLARASPNCPPDR